MLRWNFIYATANRKVPNVLAFEIAGYAVLDKSTTLFEACETHRLDVVNTFAPINGIDIAIALNVVLQKMARVARGSSSVRAQHVLDGLERLYAMTRLALVHTDTKMFELLLNSSGLLDDVSKRKLVEYALSTGQIARAASITSPIITAQILTSAIARGDVRTCDMSLDLHRAIRPRFIKNYVKSSQLLMVPFATSDIANWYINTILPCAPDARHVIIASACLCGDIDLADRTLALYPDTEPQCPWECLKRLFDRTLSNRNYMGRLRYLQISRWYQSKFIPRFAIRDSIVAREFTDSCSKRQYDKYLKLLIHGLDR